VYAYDLYATARYSDSDENGDGDGELVRICITSPQDGVRRLTVPTTTLLSKEKARELLVKHGVVALNKQLEDIMAYFASTIRDLQRKSPATRMHNQMGWTADLDGFVVGETEYTLHGPKFTPASLATRSITPYLASKGSLENWRSVVDFYAQPGMEAHALAVFFGFGAVLLKLVGGLEPRATELAAVLYERGIDRVVRVSTAEVAEAAKILENTFRAVNIALVNELKLVLTPMGIDVWEVIEAASTKPFGYMPFWPGPGLGGHCIPIDPFYLTWKAREVGQYTRFIELAGEINASMPSYVLKKIVMGLNNAKKSLNGARVLVLGAAYKQDIDDMRESPSLALMDKLQRHGAIVEYSDPHVPVIPKMPWIFKWFAKKSCETAA
jgi:hypothetical protein